MLREFVGGAIDNRGVNNLDNRHNQFLFHKSGWERSTLRRFDAPDEQSQMVLEITLRRRKNLHKYLFLMHFCEKLASRSIHKPSMPHELFPA